MTDAWLVAVAVVGGVAAGVYLPGPAWVRLIVGGVIIVAGSGAVVRRELRGITPKQPGDVGEGAS